MNLSRSLDKFSAKFKGDPQHALTFLRALGRLWTIWPLDPEDSWIKKAYHEFSLWFIIANLFITSVTLWISVCSCGNYPVLMAKNLSQLMIINDSFSHLVLYRINRSDLGVLIDQVFAFFKKCKKREKLVMREHYRHFFSLYIVLIVLYAIAALAFFCGAFILKKDFPVDATYPFPTDSILVSSIIYAHQTFSIVQNSVIIMIDLLILTLFWYAGARMRLLGCRLRVVETDDQLKQCIRDHQDIIQFVQYAVKTVRFILYKTVSIVAIILISAGLQLLYFDAKTVLSQFFLIIIVASLRIITYSSTIDEIKELNDNLRWTIYTIEWLESSEERTKRNLLIFMHRCQAPLISVNGQILDIISLQFFAKFMYTIISHLTTLRAIIERTHSNSIEIN